MELNLGSLMKQDNMIMPRKGGKVRLPEETFMMKFISAATNSTYIGNVYDLNVNVKHEGCTCCSKKPSISVPLTIIPLSDPSVFGFPEPAGFSPYQLGYKSFVLPGASAEPSTWVAAGIPPSIQPMQNTPMNQPHM
jgi:hypothetical protein